MYTLENNILCDIIIIIKIIIITIIIVNNNNASMCFTSPPKTIGVRMNVENPGRLLELLAAVAESVEIVESVMLELLEGLEGSLGPNLQYQWRLLVKQTLIQEQ
jgi:hypothetical protein